MPYIPRLYSSYALQVDLGKPYLFLRHDPEGLPRKPKRDIAYTPANNDMESWQIVTDLNLDANYRIYARVNFWGPRVILDSSHHCRPFRSRAPKYMTLTDAYANL